MDHPVVDLGVARFQDLVGTVLALDPSLAAVDAVTCLAEVVVDAATVTSFHLDVVNATSCQDVVVRPVDQAVAGDAVTVTSYAAGDVATATSFPGVAYQAAAAAVDSGCSLVAAVVLAADVVTYLM